MSPPKMRMIEPKDPSDPDTDPGMANVANVLLEIKEILINLGHNLAVREANRDKEFALLRQLAERSLTRTVPPKLPSLSEFHPEQTPAGGHMMISPEMWQALQQRIADIDHEKAIEEAKTLAVKTAMKELEEKGDKTRARLSWLIGIATVVAGALGWIGRHLLIKE
jgi:hypothetical protein